MKKRNRKGKDVETVLNPKEIIFLGQNADPEEHDAPKVCHGACFKGKTFRLEVKNNN